MTTFFLSAIALLFVIGIVALIAIARAIRKRGL